MEEVNFINTLGTLRVYCFVYGHGSRLLATHRNVPLEQVSELVNRSCNEYIAKTRFPKCHKIFSYKYEC